MIETVLFYVFSAILLGSALAVIVVRNPVHAAIFLVLAFFTAAAVWLLLRAEFLALALLLVYVGAVMVLFLFVVMMVDVNLERLRAGFWRHLPLALAAGAVMVLEMVAVIASRHYGAPRPDPRPAEVANTRELGRLVYTEYVYAFEIAAVVLLVAIVAAIALTLRKRHARRGIDAALAVRVRRQDRVQLVPLRAEKDES